MARKPNIPTIFFNASVILAGFSSPRGGSALLLKWARDRKIKAVISEVILDEINRKSIKIGVLSTIATNRARKLCQIIPAPSLNHVNTWTKTVIDVGDAHVLASAKEAKVDYLVSLDKKHILILKAKIRAFKIVSPKELIEVLEETAEILSIPGAKKSIQTGLKQAKKSQGITLPQLITTPRK